MISPNGPQLPASFVAESRRANDGELYIGQNKFDEKGVQINDFVLEFAPQQTTDKAAVGISKYTKFDCPKRLRGQHCKVYFEN